VAWYFTFDGSNAPAEAHGIATDLMS